MPQKSKSLNYEKHRAQMLQKSRERSLLGREIGPLPPIKDKERRAKCAKSLSCFLSSYFPNVFYDPFSEDHLKAIAAIESTIHNGGKVLLIMPRASGKSSIIKYAALWSLLYGYRKFVVIVAAEAKLATQISRSLQEALSSNELLLEDFPEACYPIRKLEGIAARAPGQLLNGQPTHILWSKGYIRLPRIPDAPSSGAIVAAFGLTSSLRGLTDGDGTTVIRPDFVFLDDPQTDRSAISPSQTEQRKRIINEAILGLGGPKTNLSAVMASTIISHNDLTEQFMHSGHWQVVYSKLLYGTPANPDLWEQYFRIYSSNKQEATKFYLQNREAMDAGLQAGWQNRYTSVEASAIQHAMNISYSNPQAFASEYQNEPLTPTDTISSIRLQDIFSRHSGHKRGEVPGPTVLALDPQLSLIYYLLLTYHEDRFIISDYGTHPAQHSSLFRASSASLKLQDVYKGCAPEQAVVAGLNAIISKYPDLQTIIDVNLGILTTTLYSEFGNNKNIILSHGSTLPPLLSPRKNEITGTGWVYGPSHRQGINRLKFSANTWKDIVASLLTADPSSPKSILYYGTHQTNHNLLLQHLTSEQRTSSGWKCKPHEENHFWDCLILALLAFDVFRALEKHKSRYTPQTRLRFSDLQKAKRNGFCNNI